MLLHMLMMFPAGSSDALTEAAQHFGRLKREKQAAQLVQRYKRFRKLLPKAEADRQQLLDSLDQTPVHERPQLVQQLKRELQSMAEGGNHVAPRRGCSAECRFCWCCVCLQHPVIWPQ